MLTVVVISVLVAIVEPCLRTIDMEPGVPTDGPFPWETTRNPLSTSPFFESSTMRNMCDTCDISDLLTDLGGNKRVPQVIGDKVIDANGCVTHTIRCYDPTIILCTLITGYGETPTGSYKLGIESPADAVFTVVCAEDGTWSGDDTGGNLVTDIETVYCIFEEPCQ